MSDDLWGDISTDWEPTLDQIIEHLLSTICPAGEPHTGDDPTSDHGHTHCMYVGAAIRLLRAKAS